MMRATRRASGRRLAVLLPLVHGALSLTGCEPAENYDFAVGIDLDNTDAALAVYETAGSETMKITLYLYQAGTVIGGAVDFGEPPVAGTGFTGRSSPPPCWCEVSLQGNRSSLRGSNSITFGLSGSLAPDLTTLEGEIYFGFRRGSETRYEGPVTFRRTDAGTVDLDAVVDPEFPVVDPEFPTGRYVLRASWGGVGTVDGRFVEPKGVAIDGSGNVWVADRKHRTIQKFDPDGQFLDKIATTAGTRGPSHLAFLNDGRLYALADEGGWVARYDESGEEVLVGTLRRGRGSIMDLGIDARNGDVYAVYPGAVVKYTSDLSELWAKEAQGFEPSPHVLAVDLEGNVFVRTTDTIQKYSPAGILLQEIDNPRLLGSARLAADASGRLYALSSGETLERIMVFDGSLNLMSTYHIRAEHCPLRCRFVVGPDGRHVYITVSIPDYLSSFEEPLSEVRGYSRR